MKKVIDTIKEILSKDASTQTEPVTIIENEENMPENIFSPIISQLEDQEGQAINKIMPETKNKRDGYIGEIQKAKRGKKIADIRNKDKYLAGEDQIGGINEETQKILSGQDHIKEIDKEIYEERTGQIQQDLSFYDKCKAYLSNVDPESYNYYGISKTTQADIRNNIDLNKSIVSVFSTHMGDFDSPEEAIDELLQATAALYVIYEEKGTTLGTGMDLINAIAEDLSVIVGIEISGQIMNTLDAYTG